MRRPCCNKEGTDREAWSKQEDQRLIDHVRAHGEGCWESLPQAAGLLRCGKSCRLRWMNHLRPDHRRRNFGEDEEDLIIKLHALLGNRWSLIAGRLPGRTDNEIKNHWNSHLRRRLLKMGIDPNNHRLSHKIPSIHQQLGSNSATSSGPKSQIICEPSQRGKSEENNDQISDAASSLNHINTCALPDLNLDLTVATSSSSLSPAVAESKQLDHKASPTLLLFV